MDEPAPTTPQALLIVDMQTDFFNDAELERCRADLVRACNTLAERAHSVGAPVFVVRTVHAPDKSTWSLNMLADNSGMTVDGTAGAGPVDGLAPGPAITVSKTRDSAFHRTGLASLLQDRDIRSVAICGVSTESCIATTAADAYAHDIRVTLVGDAVASIDPHLHEHTLASLAQQYRQPALRPRRHPVRGARSARVDVTRVVRVGSYPPRRSTSCSMAPARRSAP